jgi:hypothetical protein
MVDLTEYFLEQSRKKRRSIFGHLTMIETLRSCFEKRIPIKDASRIAETSDSTTRKYYTKWKMQRRQGRNFDYYFEHELQIKQVRARLFKNLERQRDGVNALVKQLNDLKKEYGVKS